MSHRERSNHGSHNRSYNGGGRREDRRDSRNNSDFRGHRNDRGSSGRGNGSGRGYQNSGGNGGFRNSQGRSGTEETFRIFGVDLRVGPCHFIRYLIANGLAYEYIDCFDEGAFVFASYDRDQLERIRRHLEGLNGTINLPGIESPVTFSFTQSSRTSERPSGSRDDRNRKRSQESSGTNTGGKRRKREDDSGF
uniref:RRM domain-containing protein n=1 Tax=Parastrongyloides trichosuri TaxID=131310 RepID=A0A0N5A1Q3_PARTI